MHTFAILDHDFPFTYVRDLHPWYRWPLSLVNYIFLAGVSYGIYLGLRRLVRRRRLDKAAFATLAAVMLSVIYLGLYAPCEPESRYSLPLFLLWSPFFVVGMFRIRQLVAYRRSVVLIKLACWFVVFVSCCVGLSAWIQYQTPRLRQPVGGLAYDSHPRLAAVRKTAWTLGGSANRR